MEDLSLLEMLTKAAGPPKRRTATSSNSGVEAQDATLSVRIMVPTYEKE